MTWRLVPLVVALGVLQAVGARAQQAVTRAPHGTLRSDLECIMSHTVDAWKPPVLRNFDHDTATAFPLTERHADLQCTSCHLKAQFDEPKARVTDCGTCHVDVHQGALGDNCLQCHNTKRFNDVPGVSVHARTGFPLTGAHLQVTCDACHPGDERGVFVTRDVTCYSCHQADYEAASPLDHVGANFPTTCEQCHTTVAFQFGVRFDHVTASGGFPLEGRHAEIRCQSCHDPATWAPLFPTRDPNDCYTCHQADYDRVHGGGFPTTCASCHTPYGWEGAEFDHDLIGFPLNNVHESLSCDRCHVVPGFALVFQPAPTSPDDCIACHQDDYNREHAGSGFPTTCLTCHDGQRWGGASFANHDSQAFPIYSGTHANRWNSCSDCHTSPSDYKVFSCFGCHGQSATAARHTEVGGYTYDSARCYACHPTGRGGD